MPEPITAPAGIDEQIPPGYFEALAADAEARDFSFLDFPEVLCGVPVLPLDLRNQIILTHAANPFIVGGTADIEDVRMLLYLQSPLYVAADRAARECFVNSLPFMDEAEAVAEVRAWLDQTFADAPPGKARPKGSQMAVIDEPIASFVASWVDLLASEYHWDEDRIVGTAARRGIPLRRLYQYHRTIARRHNPKSDYSSTTLLKVWGNWLRASIKKDKEQAATPAA